MKIRVFQTLEDSVFRVVICTEDWSEGDLSLIFQYGEPEVNVGGEIPYIFDGESRTKLFGDMYLRILHGFPYSRGFDSRDYQIYVDDGGSGSDLEPRNAVEEAMAVGKAWKEAVISRITDAVRKLRENQSPVQTEEISEV